MAFESFDAAPLIEIGAFVPAIPAMTEGVPDTVTLDAALREAARAEMRAEASILDLWVERPGASNFRVLEGPAFTAGTSRHAWAIMAGDDGALILSPGDAKDPTLRAAFGDDDWDEEEGIVVVGPGGDDGGDTGGGNIGGYGDGSYPGGPEGPGIGEGGTGDNLDQQEQNDCRDRNALDAKTAIRADSNSSYKEHASVVYRDANGQVQHSPPIEGGWGQIPMAEVVAWMNANGVSMSQMIGFVHNHDPYNYGNATELNRYPSGGDVPGGDWNAAAWFVSQGAGGPGGENFAMYIIDPAWRMREFEYADRAMYMGLNKTQRENGMNLPGETQSDGSTCG